MVTSTKALIIGVSKVNSLIYVPVIEFLEGGTGGKEGE